jgi:hypothetical protein
MSPDLQDFSMSHDQSFGADRHDLRSHLLDAEREAKGLISRAAQAARRILRRAPETPSDGAALSRVAGTPAHGRTATNLRS